MSPRIDSIDAAPAGQAGSPARARRHAGVAASLVAAMGLAAGCAVVGPNYRAPQAEALLPPVWAQRVPHAGDPVDLARWWQGFADPVLASLIEDAQRESPTVGQALARVHQSRAALVAAYGAQAPQADARTGASRATQFLFLPGGAQSIPITTLQVGVDTSWEADLFGRLERGVQAARAQVAAEERGWHDARATVAAEVARGYVQARGCAARRDALARQTESTRGALRIDELRLSAGRIAAAEIAQTRASLAELRVRVADAQAQCAAAAASLSQLTGRPVGALRERLGALPLELPRFGGDPGVPVPAEALRQRPDVAAAERRLAAASARIGEAQAAQYPSFSIAGALSYNRASALGSRFTYSSWSIAPGLRLPVLDGSRRRAQVEQREAEYAEAYDAWRAQVLRAAAEAESALGDVGAALDRADAADEARAQYDRAFEAEQARVRVGRSSTLELERARRALITAQSAAIDARERLALGWIGLYKALGGGWDARLEPPSR